MSLELYLNQTKESLIILQDMIVTTARKVERDNKAIAVEGGPGLEAAVRALARVPTLAPEPSQVHPVPPHQDLRDLKAPHLYLQDRLTVDQDPIKGREVTHEGVRVQPGVEIALHEAIETRINPPIEIVFAV